MGVSVTISFIAFLGSFYAWFSGSGITLAVLTYPAAQFLLLMLYYTVENKMAEIGYVKRQG